MGLFDVLGAIWAEANRRARAWNEFMRQRREEAKKAKSPEPAKPKPVATSPAPKPRGELTKRIIEEYAPKKPLTQKVVKATEPPPEQGFTQGKVNPIRTWDVSKVAEKSAPRILRTHKARVSSQVERQLEERGYVESVDTSDVAKEVQSVQEKLTSKLQEGKWYVEALARSYEAFTRTTNKYAERVEKLNRELLNIYNRAREAISRGDVEEFNRLKAQFEKKKLELEQTYKTYKGWYEKTAALRRELETAKGIYERKATDVERELKELSVMVDKKLPEVTEEAIKEGMERADVSLGERIAIKGAEYAAEGRKVIEKALGDVSKSPVVSLPLTAMESAAATMAGGIGMTVTLAEDIGRLGSTLMGKPAEPRFPKTLGAMVFSTGKLAEEHLEAITNPVKLPSVIATDVGIVAGGYALGKLGGKATEKMAKGIDELRPRYEVGRLTIDITAEGVKKGGKPFEIGAADVLEWKLEVPKWRAAPTERSIFIDAEVRPGKMGVKPGEWKVKLPELETRTTVIDYIGETALKKEWGGRYKLVPKLPEFLKRPEVIADKKNIRLAMRSVFEGDKALLDWVKASEEAFKKGEAAGGKIYGLGEGWYRLRTGGKEYTTGDYLVADALDNYVLKRLSVFVKLTKRIEKGSVWEGLSKRLRSIFKIYEKSGERTVTRTPTKSIEMIFKRLERRLKSEVPETTTQAGRGAVQKQMTRTVEKFKVPDLTKLVAESVERALKTATKPVKVTAIEKTVPILLPPRPTISLKDRLKLVDRFVERVENSVETSIRQVEVLEVGELPRIEPINIETTDVGTRTTTITTQSITLPEVKLPPPPKIEVPAPTTPPKTLKSAPPIRTSKTEKHKEKGVGRKWAKYTPTIGAIALGITAPKVTFEKTGLLIRPVKKAKKRKKRRGRKR